MRARVAMRSQWKDLLIDTFPSLALGKLFTEEGRREVSSLTTIFVTKGLPAHSVLCMQCETKPWIRLALAANWFDWDSSIYKLIQTGLLRMMQRSDLTDHLTFFCNNWLTYWGPSGPQITSWQYHSNIFHILFVSKLHSCNVYQL